MYGLYLSFSNEDHKIIGKRGKTQGANTVKIPAKNETNNIVIYNFFSF